MAETVTSIVTKIEAIAQIKKDLRTEIVNAGGELSDTAPFSEYPEAIKGIKNADYRILETNNLANATITSNGSVTFNVSDDLTIDDASEKEMASKGHVGWKSFTVNVNVKDSSGGNSGNTGGGSGGNGGTGGSDSGNATLPKFRVIFLAGKYNNKMPYDSNGDWDWKAHYKDVEFGSNVEGDTPLLDGYQFHGWNPLPDNITDKNTTRWQGTEPYYDPDGDGKEDTVGYFICNATWRTYGDRIEESWEEIIDDPSGYRVGQYKRLEFAPIKGEIPITNVYNGAITGYQSYEISNYSPDMAIVSVNGGLTWMAKTRFPQTNVVYKLPSSEWYNENRIKNPDRDPDEPVKYYTPYESKQVYCRDKISSFMSTDYYKWLNSNVLNACKEVVANAMKSVNLQANGMDSKGLSTRVTITGKLAVAPLSYVMGITDQIYGKIEEKDSNRWAYNFGEGNIQLLSASLETPSKIYTFSSTASGYRAYSTDIWGIGNGLLVFKI